MRFDPVVEFFVSDPLLLVRYIGAGAVSALVEFLLFAALYELAGWPLLVANSSAFAVALVICFTLQKRWTFRATGGLGRQAFLYLAMQAVSAAINNALVYIFVAELGLNAPGAKVLQIGLVFLWNFTFSRIVIFPERVSKDEACRVERRLPPMANP